MSCRSPDTCHYDDTSQRLVSVVQCLSLVAAGTAESRHHAALGHSARALAQALAKYLCLSRTEKLLRLLIEFTPTAIRRMFNTSPNSVVGVGRLLSVMTMLIFRLSEGVALLASEGVLSTAVSSYTSWVAPRLLFYYNLLKVVTSAALLRTIPRISFEATDTQNVFRKRRYLDEVLKFLEGVGLMIYAMTLLPGRASSSMVTFQQKHLLGRTLTAASAAFPPALPVSVTTQGMIGLAATLPSFLMSS
uniref:Gim5A protein n=1 Tax=Trypanosoma congolense (strain IL3000) TaxID=1068625 RepID=G0UUK5_TRYCI|nr:conserved hypothetical protein [Trypanosoma congolense IL3000]